MRQHTKGPWEYNIFDDVTEIRGSDTRLVCEIPDAPLDNEDKTNLRLIIAAPELLETAQALFEVYTEGTFDINEQHKLFKNLEQALKKASQE